MGRRRKSACDHSTEAALRDPPGGSWTIKEDAGQRSIVCRECGKFFGNIVESKPKPARVRGSRVEKRRAASSF